MNDYTDEAGRMGQIHGHNAGSWVFDGNTDTETIRNVLRMIEDGDPQWEIPAPLSGEWAGDPTTDTIADELGVGDEYRAGHIDLSEAFEAYEDAYYQAYQDEVERSGRAML